MVALNAAMMTDGLVIKIADGAALLAAADVTRSRYLKLEKMSSPSQSYIAGAGCDSYQVRAVSIS